MIIAVQERSTYIWKARTNDWFQILFAKGTPTDAVDTTSVQASIIGLLPQWTWIEMGSPDAHNFPIFSLAHPTDFAQNLLGHLLD